MGASIFHAYKAQTYFQQFRTSLGGHQKHIEQISPWGPLSKSSGCQNPPTPASVRRYQFNECRVWLESASIVAPWIIHGLENLNSGTLKPPKSRCFCNFGPPFGRTKKHQKNILPEPMKISKKSDLGSPRL